MVFFGGVGKGILRIGPCRAGQNHGVLSTSVAVLCMHLSFASLRCVVFD